MCERMVRTTKDSLRRTLYKSDLNWEQLRTAIAEVEYAVNSRPQQYWHRRTGTYYAIDTG